MACGPLEVDVATHTATFEGVPIELRRMEFALLAHLARDPTRVHEKADILRELHGWDVVWVLDREYGNTRVLIRRQPRVRNGVVRDDTEHWEVFRVPATQEVRDRNRSAGAHGPRLDVLDDLASNVLSAEQTNELLVRSRDECRSLIACACVVDVETEPVCIQDRAKRLRHDRVGETPCSEGRRRGADAWVRCEPPASRAQRRRARGEPAAFVLRTSATPQD